MKIILAEESGGTQQSSGQSFQKEVVRIGRDAGESDFAFDNRKFPMVSRRHAELRWQNREWILFDNNSSYGTFVNGEKINEPRVVSTGDKLQFGLQGPILKVLWFETENAKPQILTKEPLPNQPILQQTPNSSRDSLSNSAPPLESNRNNQPPILTTAQIEFVGGNFAPFKITKDSIWLGRDPDVDIVFDASATMVSRRHAEIRREAGGNFIVADNGSFNGTLVNNQRISAAAQLFHGDEIQLGLGAPILRFTAPTSANVPERKSVVFGQSANLQNLFGLHGSKTMVNNLSNLQLNNIGNAAAAAPQLLMSIEFGGKQKLTIGRGDGNDIKLDGLQISNRHAQLLKTNSGIVIEDLKSTNGVTVNGNRIARQLITPNDAAQIGSFQIRIDAEGHVGVFDMRAKTRIDAVNLSKEIKNRSVGTIRLLDNVSLSIQPNEFVGLLGASGAGKSTLMDAMNGMRPASAGSVLINNLDLYEHLDSLKQTIGYVPQDETIHRELTVRRTLFYIAKLRLSGDVSTRETSQIIDEVLDVTGLTERQNVPVKELSGGQRKRVSIAVELVTKPSIIFLDEPTSGLDPATEERIMRLFRQIAESGRTVVLTTHAMENVKLFDKIVVLMRGKLVFYGKPDEALKYFGAASFKELYDKIEEPAEREIKQKGEQNRLQITEQIAEQWKRKFTETPQFRENIFEPQKSLGKTESHAVNKHSRLGVFGSIRQTLTLSRRYAEVLLRDRLNLFILFAQAPIIAVLTYFVMDANQPRDFVYFVLALVSVWFGISVSAREIVRERAVYRRERMVNLGLLPYLFSKLLVLGGIVGVQCFLLFVPLKILDLAGLMPMPGELFGVPQFWVMLLTAGVGIALGLLISALVKTSEMATSLVPLILIPQILFSGLVGVPSGVNKIAGLAMPAAWSFDAMKRFSTLDTLEAEGAEAAGETNGLGLYKYVETENNKIVVKANRELDDYKEAAQKKLNAFEDDLRSGNSSAPVPMLDEPPKIGDAKKIPADLSRYISFLHPWMSGVLNQIVLMLMFSILIIVTLLVLRLRDN